MEIPHSITEIENYITKFLPGGIIINKNPNINNSYNKLKETKVLDSNIIETYRKNLQDRIEIETKNKTESIYPTNNIILDSDKNNSYIASLTISEYDNSIILDTILKENCSDILHIIISKDSILFILKNISITSDDDIIPVLFFSINGNPSFTFKIKDEIIEQNNNFIIYNRLGSNKFKQIIESSKKTKNNLNITYGFNLDLFQPKQQIFNINNIEISRSKGLFTILNNEQCTTFTNNDISKISDIDDIYIKLKNNKNREDFTINQQATLELQSSKSIKYSKFEYKRENKNIVCKIISVDGTTKIITSSFINMESNTNDTDVIIELDMKKFNLPSNASTINIIMGGDDHKTIYWCYKLNDNRHYEGNNRENIRYYYICQNLYRPSNTNNNLVYNTITDDMMAGLDF